jgi:hypothetical protein
MQVCSLISVCTPALALAVKRRHTVFRTMINAFSDSDGAPISSAHPLSPALIELPHDLNSHSLGLYSCQFGTEGLRCFNHDSTPLIGSTASIAIMYSTLITRVDPHSRLAHELVCYLDPVLWCARFCSHWITKPHLCYVHKLHAFSPPSGHGLL